MIQLPPHLFSQYRSFCTDNGVNDNEFADHVKWLRYFLDFCEKYRIMGDDAERTGLFLDTHCVPVRTVKEARSPLVLE